MKLLLLKILLQRRGKDDGYVLPMVIAIGLVMVLLGAVNLTSAKEENFNAITQNSRSDALSIAEVGVAKYRELLDRNRILTVYNRNEWVSNNVNGVDVAAQTCDVISNTTNGWASNEPPNTAFNAANWRAVNLNETVLNRDLNGDGDNTDVSVTTGWYKIVDYEYDIDGTLGGTDNDGVPNPSDDNGVFSVVSDANTDDDAAPFPPGVTAGSIVSPTTGANPLIEENDRDDDGDSDARGILTVKGRTLDGSEAQIQVEIPIRINDLNNFAPVLWVNSGTLTPSGTLNVGGADNIVLTGTGANCTTTPPVINGTTPIIDPRGVPPIISNPTTGTPAVGFTPAIPAIPTANRNIFGDVNTSTSELLLPRPLATQDNKTADGERFLYEVNSLNVIDNNLLVDGVAKVTLYVDGIINFTNTAPRTLTIGNLDATRPGKFAAATSNVSSHNLEIYSNSTQINIDARAGDINIEALIHAPAATLTVTGGGTVNINGAVWVNNLDVTSGTTLNITGDQTDAIVTNAAGARVKTTESSYKFYTTSANRTPRPITNSPTNWKTEEVN